MPFVSRHESTPVENWGVAKGSVRHILVESDKTHASYVIEEPPGVKSMSIVISDSKRWSHDVFLPWRYSVIRVRWDGRVSLGNCGWVYFSNKKAEDLEEKTLFPAVLPNVFQNGSICLGYGSLWDRSPVRSAWKAVRRIYPDSNQWIHGDVPPAIISRPRESGCLDHVCKGGLKDFLCTWSKLSEKEVSEIDWSIRKASKCFPISISSAASICSSTKVYQGEYQFDDYNMEKSLQAHDDRRRFIAGGAGRP